MLQRHISTILLYPILWCPAIVIEATDAGVTCSNPVIAGKACVEDPIHILVDGNICIKEDAGFVGRQLETTQLGLYIFETRGYKGGLLVDAI